MINGGKWVVVLGAAWVLGCDAFAGDTPAPAPGPRAEAGADATAPSDDGGMPADAPSDAPGADVDNNPDADRSPCDTAFRFVPTSGQTIQSAYVSGEWNAFASPGVQLKPDGTGAFTGNVKLAPGLVAYKLILDGNWQLDPGAGLRKYVGGVENSAVRVANCHLPSLTLASKSIARAGAGQGTFTAAVVFHAASDGAEIDPASLKASVRKDGAVSAAAAPTLDASKTKLGVSVPQLGDGKYTVFIEAADRAGRKAAALRLVFWIEASDFDWKDAVMYMAMVDRFQDGDPSNNAPPTAGVDPRADYRGGDLQGIRAAIADGTFDKLGVRTLWLSPFHQNPAGAYKADDGTHMVTGYHGYWPVKPRTVDPRIGGDAALKALVKEAHAHGIRVLQDFVVNHVHQEHEYFQQHPSWFRTGCVCGTASCDWTTHRLDCLFADYLPDVNWTVPEVSEQYADDAVYWLDTFDLDGLRVDAVKHVEDLAVANMSARIRGEFEAAGTRVFLTGETAMGWSDCGLACNKDQYDTISRYIGPFGLDGQADFVLYHAVPYRVFAYDQKGMLHADYWAQQSTLQYPSGAIMTPYVGSHDTARFVTLASYRGQDASHDPGIPGNKWTNIAGPPPDSEPYARQRLAMSWLMGLGGVPLIYYGDEYGEWGGADPNNRVMWRGRGTLSTDEQTTLTRMRALGTARRELTALRRGNYQSLFSTEDVLVFARQAQTNVAIVALSRAPAGTTSQAPIGASLGLANGTVLHDRLGGPDVSVVAGAISVTLGARGAAILAP